METIVTLLVVVLWLSVIVYAIVLATRLVTAVEQIARSLSRQQPPDLIRPQ